MAYCKLKFCMTNPSCKYYFRKLYIFGKQFFIYICCLIPYIGFLLIYGRQPHFKDLTWVIDFSQPKHPLNANDWIAEETENHNENFPSKGDTLLDFNPD